MDLIISLGKWKKEKGLNVNKVRKEWRLFCLEHGWEFDELEVRDPKHNTFLRNSSGDHTDWHRDGNIIEGTAPIHLIVWATVKPTLIKTPDHQVHIPQPYEVVVFNNILCDHMVPEFTANNRWFIRGWCAKQKG